MFCYNSDIIKYGDYNEAGVICNGLAYVGLEHHTVGNVAIFTPGGTCPANHEDYLHLWLYVYTGAGILIARFFIIDTADGGGGDVILTLADPEGNTDIDISDYAAYSPFTIMQLPASVLDADATMYSFLRMKPSQIVTRDNGNVITAGRQYRILKNEHDADFTNIGAPDNDIGTTFTALTATPAFWGRGKLLELADSERMFQGRHGVAVGKKLQVETVSTPVEIKLVPNEKHRDDDELDMDLLDFNTIYIEENDEFSIEVDMVDILVRIVDPSTTGWEVRLLVVGSGPAWDDPQNYYG